MRCLECREQNKGRHTARIRRRAAKLERRRYRANHGQRLAALKVRRTAKKILGQCRDCRQPIAEDTIYCAGHLERKRITDRERWRYAHAWVTG